MARGKPAEIGVTADTREFTKQIDKGVLAPLDDVQTALEDVSKAGDDTGHDLEQAMKAAQDDTERLAKETQNLHDVIEKGSKASYKKMANAADDGFDKASHSAQDLKDESKAAFGEMAGSFDGSLDSMVGSAQGLMGGLAASGGPIALAAGAIGVSSGIFYNMWKANAEKTKQRVADMYDDMLESQQGFLSDSYKVNEYWKILKGDEGALLSLDKVAEYAKRTGLTHEQVALAWAGDTEQMIKVEKALGDNIDDNRDKAKKSHGEQKTAYLDEVSWSENILKKARARTDEITDTTAKVKTGKDAWNAYGSEAAHSLGTQNKQLGKVYDSLGSINAAVKSIPDANVKVKLDTKELDNGVRKLTRQGLKVPVTLVTRDGKKIQ